MRTIMLANAKGGSGKSTLATNLACFYACWGVRVTLLDFDPQESGLDWLGARPKELPAIQGVAAHRLAGIPPVPSEYAIIDLPSGIQGRKAMHLIRRADTVIVPVLPSPMDIRATARFLVDLRNDQAAAGGKTRICVVANRVRTQTRIYHTLQGFLRKLDIAFVATFRETQNYIVAAESGRGIFELPLRTAAADLEQWQPLVRWLNEGAQLGVIPPGAQPEEQGEVLGTTHH